jgi:lipopolysaccharide transport system ATP-binding protein
MYVRLAFAVAAHLEPEILIVDEVLAVGDAEFQRKCLSRMQQVVSTGVRSILFVSHNLGAVRALCTSTIVLSRGGVAFQGDVDEGIRRYLDAGPASADTVDLEARRDRSGKGAARLKLFEVQDEQGRPKRTAFVGEAVRLVAKLNAPLSHPVFVIRFVDASGTPVFSFDSGRGLGLPPAEARSIDGAVCILPQLLLAPGRYRVDAWVSSEGVMQDEVDAIATLEVDNCPLDGRLHVFRAGYGSAVCPHSWTTAEVGIGAK